MARPREIQWAKWLTGAFTALVLVVLHLPVLVVFIFSFSDSTIISFPFEHWTTRWYHSVLFEPSGQRLREALLNSLEIASIATLTACILGTLTAFALQRYRFFGRSFYRVSIAIPLLLPGVVTGIALLVYFKLIGIRQGFTAVLIGHITFCIPVVFGTVASRVSRLPRSMEEAAADLGANLPQRLIRVVLPSIFSAVLSGALLAFTLSLDEIVVTYFLSSGSTTLPVAIYTGLRLKFQPDNLAIVSLIIGVSGVLILLSQWLVRERK